MGDRDLILSRIRGGTIGSLEKASLFQKHPYRNKRGAAQDKDFLLETFRKECEQLFVDVRVAKKEEDLRDILFSIVKESGVQDIKKCEDPLWEKAHMDQILAETGVQVLRSPAGPSLDAGDRRDFIRVSSEAGLGISSVDFALADTGTLVLKHVPGRDRASSLLPPVYAAFVKSENIIPGLDELLERLQDDFEKNGRLASCITLISGPSKTADIEMTLVYGVHGPGKVYVVVLDY